MTKGKIILSVVSSLCCAAAFAQPADHAFTLDQVVITGTRTEKRLAESPVPTTLIGERDIRKAAAVSALESLQDNIPGIVVSPNAMGNNMRIKGLNSRYILFLVDGERLVPEGAGGNINFDQIDVATIRRIEVVDGASSALYGSNAVGAVINIITKEPVHNVEAGAAQTWESPGTWRSKVDFGSATRRFTVRGGGFRNSSDGFGAGGDGAYAARYKDLGANLKLGYRPAEKADINVLGRWFRHETFNPEGSMDVAHPLTDNLAIGANGGFTAQTNSLKVSVNFDRYFDSDVLERRGGDHARKNSASSLSVRAVDACKPSEQWELVGGVEYNHELNWSKDILGAVPTSRRTGDANVFAQADYKPLERLDIVGGARYTRNSQFGGAFTPKLSAMWRTGDLKFRGGVGTAFRAPSIRELYYDFDHQGMFWVYGNPDLKPEKGVYTSLSAEYSRGGLNLSAAAYHNRVSGKITQYDVIDQTGANEKHYKNVSRATLRGVDVNAACTLRRQVQLRGSYSLCDAVDNSTGRQLESNVRHSGTVSATWNGNIRRSPFSLQLAGRLNSPIHFYEQGARTRSKSYSVWKAVLSKPFTAGGNVLEATFKVDNIFGFRDVSFVNPGRQYLIGVRYNFKHNVQKHK